MRLNLVPIRILILVACGIAVRPALCAQSVFVCPVETNSGIQNCDPRSYAEVPTINAFNNHASQHAADIGRLNESLKHENEMLNRQVEGLKKNVKDLADANDALAKRLDNLEKQLKQSSETGVSSSRAKLVRRHSHHRTPAHVS
jgi:regulator of replication initiation timing